MAKIQTSSIGEKSLVMGRSELIKILIVDDNRIIRHLLRLTFSDHSRFQVGEAADSDQAISIAKVFLPDVIILDVMLPGQHDGIELCRLIKRGTEFQQTKIIMLSARSQQQDLELGKNAGADLYITKPFSPKNLLISIDKLLKE